MADVIDIKTHKAPSARAGGRATGGDSVQREQPTHKLELGVQPWIAIRDARLKAGLGHC